MTAVVFETPGLIDLRSFTILGANAKPRTDNPIGYFGTGLKYAIAILVRLGAEPVVWVGRDKLTFSKKESTFRGKPLSTVKMSVLRDGNVRPTSVELPFTTDYGRNWEPWMAFRELEANTRDERGKTYLIDGFDSFLTSGSSAPTGDKTLIIVKDCPEFYAEAEKIDSIFLPRAKRSGTLLEAISADDRPDASDENWLYYRTMRALEVDKPTLYTYNFLESLTLTEDRTLAYTFQVRDVLARWVLSEATEAQVEAIVTADEDWWEHGLEYPGHVAPSIAFSEVMKRRPKGTSRYALGYWSGRSSEPAFRRPVEYKLFEAHPRPWKLDGDWVFDGEGDVVFERPKDAPFTTWAKAAAAILERLDAAPGEKPAEEAPIAEETTPCSPVPESAECQRVDPAWPF